MFVVGWIYVCLIAGCLAKFAEGGAPASQDVCDDTIYSAFLMRSIRWFSRLHEIFLSETSDSKASDIASARWFFSFNDKNPKDGQWSREEFHNAFIVLYRDIDKLCGQRLEKEYFQESNVTSLAAFLNSLGLDGFKSLCSVYPAVENGIVSANGSLDIGATYSIVCKDGYVLEGSAIRKCGENREWTGETPICKQITCEPLPEIKNADLNGQETVFLSTRTYHCHDGLVLEGSSMRVCQSNGQWSGSTPQCINPCLPNPCYNNGTCLSSDSEDCIVSSNAIKFCCLCREGFTGQQCDKERGCALSPCFPGVDCHEKGDSYACGECPKGLQGDGIICRRQMLEDYVSIQVADAQTDDLIANSTIRVHLVTENGTSNYYKGSFFETVNVTYPYNSSIVIAASAEEYLSSSLLYKSSIENGSNVILYLRKKAKAVKFRYNMQQNRTIIHANTNQFEGNSAQNHSADVMISIPSGSLNTSDGAEIEITLTGVDPAVSLAGVPQLIAIDNSSEQGGDRVNLNSYGLAEVSIRNSKTKEDVKLLSPVELTIPLNPELNVSAGETIPAWYFDEESGVWIQEGYGIVEENEDGLKKWVYNASHFTWWNADAPWTDKSCVHVIAKYENEEPVSDVTVHLSGLPRSFLYSVSGKTNSQGRICFNFKRNGLAQITSFGGDKRFYSKPLQIRGGENAAVCPGTSDWSTSTAAPSTSCKVVTLMCDCSASCVNGQSSDSLTIRKPISAQSNQAVVNLASAVKFASSSCIRQRFDYAKRNYKLLEEPSGHFFIDTETEELIRIGSVSDQTTYSLEVDVTLVEDDAQSVCNCGPTTVTARIELTVITEKFATWEFTDSGMTGHSNREYSDPESVTNSPWSVDATGTDLSFRFENSLNCDGQNDNTQTGTARGQIRLRKSSKLSISWTGLVEHQAGSFERLSVKVNNQIAILAGSVSNARGCAMGRPTSEQTSPVSLSLEPGDHQIEIEISSGDGAYHSGAYYNVVISVE